MIYIFDVIFYENHFVGDLPLYKRKTILERLRVQPPFHLVDYSTLRNLKENLTEAVKKGFEGIVAKNPASFYQVGEQAPMATIDWRKIK